MGIVGGKKIKVGKWHEMPRKKHHFSKMYLGNGVILSDDTKYSGRSRVIRGREGRREGRMGGRGEREGPERSRVTS